MKPSPVGRQEEVVRSESPVTIVLGGAGTGKTTTAALAAQYHLAEATAQRERKALGARRLASPRTPSHAGRVLFLSFSRSAVAQIVRRATPVLAESIDQVEWSTFHGFAYRVLVQFAPDPGKARQVVSPANAKVPGSPDGYTFAELIPAAVRALADPTVRAHYEKRYSMVICDEFQDTDDHEWALVQSVAPSARRILLGDLNQSIYKGFKKIDPESRIAKALETTGSQLIELGTTSLRDPSQVLVRAAEAARRRDFRHESIAEAVATGRLELLEAEGAAALEAVVDRVAAEVALRRSVAVFTHTNAATDLLSETLADSDLEHEPVGLNIAYGEAIAAMLELTRFALTGAGAVRRALAVFVTSESRERGLPELARQILDKSNPHVEAHLTSIAGELVAGGRTADARQLRRAIERLPDGLFNPRCSRAWVRASRQFYPLLTRGPNGGIAPDVLVAAERLRTSQVLDSVGQSPSAVQVMNLHQTKGREAQTTVLLLQSDEYHGGESEPFPEGSRLLYVVMTRASERAVVVTPPYPHPLWSPLVAACRAARSS